MMVVETKTVGEVTFRQDGKALQRERCQPCPQDRPPEPILSGGLTLFASYSSQLHGQHLTRPRIVLLGDITYESTNYR
jgi:hypothetical protein